VIIEKWNVDGLIGNLKKNQIPKALETAGILVEGLAKLLCPVDTHFLQGSITHDVNSEGDAVRIGTNVEYGIYQELGTVKMAAQPYLRPALYHSKENILKIFNSGSK
jgi:HK97 gp10 family phage protein